MSGSARSGYRFANWARNHRARPALYHTPAEEAELADIFAQAAAAGRRVRFVGAGHSWTDIACTDGDLVRLDALDALLDVDAEAHRAKVEAGIRLSELSKKLAENGLGLPNLGSISEQSVAGAISTATHGTGVGFGNLATFVTGMRLVTPSGGVRDLTSERDPELMAAARVSLGCLGGIARVTLQCEPSFNLEEDSQVITFDEAVDQLDELAGSSEHVKLWWLPHTDRVWLNRFRRTDAPRAHQNRFGRWIDAHVMSAAVFPALLRVGAAVPPLIPTVNRLVARAHFKRVSRVDWAPRVFNVPGAPRHDETEWAIERGRAAEGLRRLRALIDDLGLRVNFLVEVRFVAADDNWLSPDYQRDTCRLGAYMYRARGWQRYFEAFEDLMVEMEGRPHWGKARRFDPDYLRRVYPRFGDFEAVRRELDPQGLLVNEFVARIFPG